MSARAGLPSCRCVSVRTGELGDVVGRESHRPPATTTTSVTSAMRIVRPVRDSSTLANAQMASAVASTGRSPAGTC